MPETLVVDPHHAFLIMMLGDHRVFAALSVEARVQESYEQRYRAILAMLHILVELFLKQTIVTRI